MDLAFFLVSEVLVKNLFGWEVRLGYINVDEGCWRWNILATVLPFRSLTSIIFLTTLFRVLTNTRFYLSSEPLAPGTNIQKMSPRLKFYDQHPKIVINFINITMSPTSLSSFVNHRFPQNLTWTRLNYTSLEQYELDILFFSWLTLRLSYCLTCLHRIFWDFEGIQFHSAPRISSRAIFSKGAIKINFI